jgi:deoxyribonuclease V
MKIFHSHPWNVSLDEAKRIQEELSKYVVKEDSFKEIKTLGGVGINFEHSGLIISIAKFSYPDLKILDLVSGKSPVLFPYIPNFFTFSCGPAILSLLGKIELPDLFIFPGRGIAHPRGVGLALRSRDNTDPIFISPGNKISIGSSLKVILHCCIKYRLPEPLRLAQILSRKKLQNF